MNIVFMPMNEEESNIFIVYNKMMSNAALGSLPHFVTDGFFYSDLKSAQSNVKTYRKSKKSEKWGIAKLSHTLHALEILS